MECTCAKLQVSSLNIYVNVIFQLFLLTKVITNLWKNEITTANVTANLNIHLKGHVSDKSDHRELHKPNKHEKLQLLKLLKMQKDGVKIIKPGQLEYQDEPYLNIIRPLWDVLERSVISQSPPLYHLWNNWQMFWDIIQRENIQKLYEYILTRLESVLRANGGKTPQRNMAYYQVSHYFVQSLYITMYHNILVRKKLYNKK